MKRLLLVGLTLALTACTPSLSGPGAADPGAATLTLTAAQGYKVVRFDAGKTDAQTVRLTLSGVGLAVNDPTCRASGAQLVCEVSTVPAGQSYVLPARGALVVEAEYGRADGKRYNLATD